MMFEMLTCNVAILAIAALYYTWKDRMSQYARRQRTLRDRVSYLLWTAAQQA
jgi:hypothetical protein